MSKVNTKEVTAKEFATVISEAIMENGATAIQHVLTQYMFGEKKFLNGLLDKNTTDENRMAVVTMVVDNIKEAFQAGGRRNLVVVLDHLIEKASAKKAGMEVL